MTWRRIFFCILTRMLVLLSYPFRLRLRSFRLSATHPVPQISFAPFL
ncbi:hypothetical protein GCWU000325_02401 [Alloprevotella tannerae ATCC 51259]|uniref:Uncharacterized protein n=1 Tax=Alloprevotella tannerae ATCC 51259 TaxID=626522 RepID=C9LJI8_9BACT|nr:hypothetical protein GCWU000325_02401 [Alloprevotella tannerae ATCC 51259]